MLKKKHTAEEKYQAIAECGKSSIHAVAKKYEIGTTTLREWIAKHESMGIDGLQEAIGRNRRTEAEKQEAVLAYAKSNQSLEDVCKRFKIRSKTQLREWIKQYNSHEKSETTSNGGGIFMTKRRTVTFEEKVEIVQFCMGNSNNNQLVFDTFDKAVIAYPEAHPLFHSDRGYQYTSKQFKAKLDAAKMTQSMSRVGRCIDNGPMEGFWGILKCEMYYLNHFDTYGDLHSAVANYICFYNNIRLQKNLNCLAPADYHQSLLVA